MPILHIIILALIQGITEFLPISSSGHLLLAHTIINADANHAEMTQNLLMDIAVHVGTLFAVLLYFRHDVFSIIKGCLAIISGKISKQEARLPVLILVGSLPVLIAGLVLYSFDPLWLRNTWLLATTTLVFGSLLWTVDERFEQTKRFEDISIKHAFLIGLAQILALIPGTSRSGITMTASRALGYNRQDSARFSLLLSVVVISGAGALGTLDLIEQKSLTLTYDIGLAALLAFLSALAAIALMMHWIKRQSFKVFAIYRIVLGLALFAALGFGLIS